MAFKQIPFSSFPMTGQWEVVKQKLLVSKIMYADVLVQIYVYIDHHRSKKTRFTQNSWQQQWV